MAMPILDGDLLHNIPGNVAQTYGKKVWDELNAHGAQKNSPNIMSKAETEKAVLKVLYPKIKIKEEKKPRHILFCPVCGDDVVKNGAIGGYVSGKPTLWCVCGARLCKGEDNSDVMVRVTK